MTGLEAKLYLLRVLPELDDVDRDVAVRFVRAMGEAHTHGPSTQFNYGCLPCLVMRAREVVANG